MNSQPDISDPFAMEDLLGFEQPCSPIGLHIRESSVLSDATQLKALKRKEQQWARWNEVIPSLIRPYMEFFHVTDSLRNLAPMNFDMGQEVCVCGKETSHTITAVYFDRKLNLPLFKYLMTVLIFFLLQNSNL